MELRIFLVGALCGSGAGLVVGLAGAGRLLPAGAAEGPGRYEVPGDVNGDGNADIGDAVYLLNCLFAEGPEPAACPPSGGGALPATGQTKCYGWTGREIACDSADYSGSSAYGPPPCARRTQRAMMI